MDHAQVAREDLRSYALRRCIRFYTALLVFCIAWSASYLPERGADQGSVRLGGVFLLVVMAGVELAAMLVSRDMARVRDRLGGGPETPRWAFAQGPWPSAVAAVFFLALAALLLLWR